MFANLDSRYPRLDRLEWSARCARPRIPRVQVAWTTVHPEQDAVLGFPGRLSVGKRGARIQPLRHQDAEQPSDSYFHEAAPVHGRGPEIYRTGAASELPLQP